MPTELRFTGVPHAAVGAVPNGPADHELALQSSPAICEAGHHIAGLRSVCASSFMHSTKKTDMANILLCASNFAPMRDERCRRRCAWRCHLHSIMLQMGVIS